MFLLHKLSSLKQQKHSLNGYTEVIIFENFHYHFQMAISYSYYLKKFA